MTPTQIATFLTERFGDAITASHPDDKHPRIHTTAGQWRIIAESLRHEPELSFDWLACLTAVDYVADEQLCCVYDLRSTIHNHWFAVKVIVSRAEPVMPTVSNIWPTADWHEREAFDMFGLKFTDHPDLRRILLPEDWEGFPLRKDYVFPKEYHGIPGTYDSPGLSTAAKA